MATFNIELPEELGRSVAKRVEQGRYEDASAVVRAALCSLELEEEQQEVKEAALRQAIEEGFASGIARGDVLARVKRKIKLEASRRAKS